jgi:hypothetical protein
VGFGRTEEVAMSDGREERKEQEERRKWEERDDRDDAVDRRPDRDWEQERVDSRAFDVAA